MATARKTAPPGKAVATTTKAAPPKAKDEEAKALAVQDAQMALLRAAGSAGDDLTAEDVALPWLKMLQDMNDETKKKHPKYVDGAEPGMFYNTVTKQLYDGDKGILVLVAAYQRSYTEWVPRKKGGGFVHDHGMDKSILSQTTREEGESKDLLPNGNEIVTSGLYYLLVVSEDEQEAEPVVFALKATQLKKSRGWNAMMKSLMIPNGAGGRWNPPKFYMAYRLTTVPESNDKGSWYGLAYTPEKSVFELKNGQVLAQAALDFQTMVKGGEARVKHEEMDDAEVISVEDEEEI